MKWFALLLILPLLYLVTQYWTIVLGMLITSLSILLLGKAIYRFGFIGRKLTAIRQGKVLQLLAQNQYSIPLEVIEQQQEVKKTLFKIPINYKKSSWLIKSVKPQLTKEGISFKIFANELNQVKIVQKQSKNSTFELMNKIAIPTQEVISKIEPQITEFNEQISKLEELRSLAASSEVYHQQAEVYGKAIAQITDLVNNAEELKKECLKFVRENLIGAELAKYNPDHLPEITQKIEFEAKYQAIKEKYDLLREEVKAYFELRKASQI
ncbi:hypothetical protein [Chroococcus sp. FPU101]|uniref:hypothetical protein n=1 Tax=Chroococcus sp. FPU101 TaxID=1974212 RepID=UPI001A8FDD43|nr:hypothetical protein [Chroococcus sp. FPU101]GFE70646.1 hypothetical protein CFPU101_32560 [Chroococcus sp. FPU101]